MLLAVKGVVSKTLLDWREKRVHWQDRLRLRVINFVDVVGVFSCILGDQNVTCLMIMLRLHFLHPDRFVLAIMDVISD